MSHFRHIVFDIVYMFPGALSTTAEGLRETAGPALEDILVDVLGPGPREAKHNVNG